MKTMSLFILSAIVAACGTPATKGDTATRSNLEAPPVASSPSESPDENGSLEPARHLSEGLIGTWQNASCGDRAYLRSISFEKSGKFAAVDEVAPCPAEEQDKCVTSGIIEWQGVWELDDRAISLESSPVSNGKLPDTVPESFVVLSTSPLSIGEQTEEAICPFQRKP